MTQIFLFYIYTRENLYRYRNVFVLGCKKSFTVETYIDLPVGNAKWSYLRDAKKSSKGTQKDFAAGTQNYPAAASQIVVAAHIKNVLDGPAQIVIVAEMQNVLSEETQNEFSTGKPIDHVKGSQNDLATGTQIDFVAGISQKDDKMIFPWWFDLLKSRKMIML